MRLCIIPARGGSKRIPRKNVRPFAGKPMIGYAIEAARASGLFDRIVVSTDHDEIARVSEAFGAEVPFRRPSDLADDFTPTVPVIAHALSACGRSASDEDQVCCLYPCVPLIDVGDIVRGHRLLDESGAPFVFPVAPFPAPVQRALRRDADGRLAPFQPEFVATRSQDLEPGYYDAGQFYWGAARAWLGGGAIHADAAGIVLPAWRVVDIDSPEDWDRAELLFHVLRART